MTRNQNLVARLSRQIALPVGQVPVFESGLNTHFILQVLERLHLVMGNTEAPVLSVVGSSVWDPVWFLRNREQMWLEFAQ